jgi:hypothetical protein
MTPGPRIAILEVPTKPGSERMTQSSADVQRVDFLVGQVQALASFALAVAATHAEPSLLKKHFERSSQVGLAKIETTLAGEKTIAGFQHVMKEIFAILAVHEG